ncbi:hypothetical protein HMJ29_12810 [Hymenobacter taeanensis]|uniref:DUF4397 domain-containing protein n=1 Tax=Hymenobacter taeanensis TaxID=2735321 RepID=A0A6M6BK97_9BACT|nr:MULTISPECIES: hypothetical protein [Hymenobacter]QJX47773.1 hypothetical protein HMJ29_12810 [Hymenobacter taeanensis]UOQ82738.1 hypothetical protein MUN83_08255 [Hymenobacter sp. 5414T-23]
MRFILAFLLALGVVHASQAKCYTEGLAFWPTSKRIQANSCILIDGFANSQRIIQGLGTSYEAFFQVGTQRVPLQVKEILVGQYGLSQAVLQPRTSLTVGEQYELIIRGKGAKSGNAIESPSGFGRDRVIYTVEAGLDQTSPTWVAPLREKSKHYVEMGCGPEVAVEFAGVVYDQSTYLVKATVKDLHTGKTTQYYLQPDKAGLVSVGHGMCAGAFMLEKGKLFSVTFSLLDASGNTTPWVGPAIQFTSPEIAG